MKRPSTKSTNALLQSLKITNAILSDDGRPNETHILLQNNWAIANNGILAIGEPILEDMFACPNAKLLEIALAKCGQSISITQLDHKLSITSGKFRALIPCFPPEDFPRSQPDPIVAQLDDRLKASLQAVYSLPEDENFLLTASVLIINGTVIATDRKTIVQAWHGIDLPQVSLPRSIIAPLIKNPKKLIGFGYSGNSVTFHFEDNSWLKSQIMEQIWPDIAHILNRPCNAMKLPEDFYIGLKSLEPFSEDGFVYFDTNKMLSHAEDVKGASYEIYGLPKGPAFNIKQLKIIEPYIKTVDWLADGPNGKYCCWFGDNIRGIIAGRV